MRYNQMVFAQEGYGVRLEWGPAGVAMLAPVCAVVVIVDVLSFSTAVDIAVGRGGFVLPLRWGSGDSRVPPGVVMAARRGSGSWSLSPASLLDLPAGTRLALPSPNGATLSAAAASSGAVVLAGCLRNASAVAAAAAGAARGGAGAGGAAGGDTAEGGAGAGGAAGGGADGGGGGRAAGAGAGRAGVIGVVAAGERWPDGTLRPAVEDQLGAGAVVAGLVRRGAGPCSPEALAAADAFHAAHHRGLADTLAGSIGGRELAADGYDADVVLAAQYDVSAVAPVLRDGAYGPSPGEWTVHAEGEPPQPAHPDGEPARAEGEPPRADGAP